MSCWSVFRKHPTKLLDAGDSSDSGSVTCAPAAPACNLQTVSASVDESVVLYHQTSLQNAQAILSSGGVMRRGPKGFGGCGIYFAVDPEATSCKANHKGVILECVVRLGRTRLVHRAGDWGGRWRQLLFGYDSVALTFLEGGIEYVIFDPSRVVSVKIHQVLLNSASTGGLSSDSSSFEISTAIDPGCGSCSSSSSGQSNGSASSSGSSDSGADECCTDTCSSLVAPCLQQHADAIDHQPSSSSSSGGLQPSSCNTQTTSSSPAQAACCSSDGGVASGSQHSIEGGGTTSDLPGQAPGVQLQQAPSSTQYFNSAGPKQRHHQGLASTSASSRCGCMLQQQSHPSCRQSGCEASRHAASVSEHMVVLLEDHMQQATCSKQLAACRPADACRQLVGA